MEYLTKENDVLDDIVFRFYGDTQNEIVEAVLDENRSIGLSQYEDYLPQGITIVLPDRPQEIQSEKLTRLWE